MSGANPLCAILLIRHQPSSLVHGAHLELQLEVMVLPPLSVARSLGVQVARVVHPLGTTAGQESVESVGRRNAH